MNSFKKTEAQPILTVLSKPERTYIPVRQMRPVIHLHWSLVHMTFARFGWKFIKQTPHFIIVRHPKANCTMHVSRMGDGHIIINQNYVMLAVNNLTDLEILADVETAPPTHTVQSESIGQKMRALLRRFL